MNEPAKSLYGEIIQHLTEHAKELVNPANCDVCKKHINLGLLRFDEMYREFVPDVDNINSYVNRVHPSDMWNEWSKSIH